MRRLGRKGCTPTTCNLRQLRTGDIVFMNSLTPSTGLTIKAVGIVTEGKVREVPSLGNAVTVRWAWKAKDRIGNLDDKWPVRSMTIYEEQHPIVQAKIIELLLGGR
jgi:hypothetical protein